MVKVLPTRKAPVHGFAPFHRSNLGEERHCTVETLAKETSTLNCLEIC